MAKQIRLNHDDDSLDTVEKLNGLLKESGHEIQFEIDEEIHDGFVLCKIVTEL